MKIAVLGANGQVGREVCLALDELGVDVVAVSRTEIGAVFLERCGIKCRYGSFDSAEAAEGLVGDCDLIADFAHPHGLPSVVRGQVLANIEGLFEGTSEKIPYVYMSTISAFGMPKADAPLKKYFLSHTMYSADKRAIERYVLKQRSSRPRYVLRLGQVHGVLQSVSREYREESRAGTVALSVSKDSLSYVVFCNTIAAVLLRIAKQKELPGIYTLVERPEWTWNQVYRFWSECEELKFKQLDASQVNRPLKQVARRITQQILKYGISFRQTVINYVPLRNLKIETRLQAIFLRRKAKAELSKPSRLTREIHQGHIPGPRLQHVSASNDEQHLYVERILFLKSKG